MSDLPRLCSPKRLIEFKHLLKPDDAFMFQATALVRAPSALVALVTKAVAAWSYADVNMTHLASAFLTLDFEPVADMVGQLRAFNVRRGLLNAAMKQRGEEDKKLFRGVMGLAAAAEERRNWYAHGLWGYHASLPDALLLLDPKDAAHNQAVFLATILASGERPDWREMLEGEANWPDEDLERISVFKEPDLQADCREIGWVSELIPLLDLALAVRSVPEEAAKARAMLFSIFQKLQSSQPQTTQRTPRPRP